MCAADHPPPATPGSPADRLRPVAPGERVVLLDVLRGFALLGILLVNMPLFNSPLALEMSPVEWWTRPLDRAVQMLIVLVAQGKFYSLFSLLFGIGLAIQLERATARGIPFPRFAARRMLVLLGIGLVHAFLIWFGDILVVYAVVGLLVIPVRKLSDRALSIGAVVLLLVPLALMAVLTGAVEAGRRWPGTAAEIESAFAEAEAHQLAELERATHAYTGGSFAEATAQRARDVLQLWTFTPFYAPPVMGMFLIGFVLGRRRFIRDPARWRPAARRWLGPLAVAGVAGSVVLVAGQQMMASPVVPSGWGLVAQAGFTAGAPALALTYAACIALGLERPAVSRLLGRMAALGRMALTNYLMHSVVCTTLFYGYGLGLFGTVRPTTGLGLALVIWLVQIPLSRAWLGRFRFGPVEWLWRSLTYGRAQPMRRIAAAQPPG